MQEVPLGTSNTARSSRLPQIYLKNRIFEEEPGNQQGQVSLIARPAIEQFIATSTTGTPHGIFYNSLGYFVFFVGTVAYRATLAGVVTVLKTGLSEATLPSIAFRRDDFFFSVGGILYHVSSTFVVTTVNLVGIMTAAGKLLFLNGHTLICETNTQRFHWILPEALTINPLNFAEAEFAEDIIVDVEKLSGRIYFFGGKVIEVWYLSGDDLAPFVPVPGLLYNVGTVANTVVKIPNVEQCLFLSSTGKVLTVGETKPLSTPAIERVIKNYLEA